MTNKGCCSCVRTIFSFLITVGMAVGGGIFLWQFLPDSNKSSLSGLINNALGSNTTSDPNQNNSSELSDDSFSNNNNSSPNNIFGFHFDKCTTPNRPCCNGLETICHLRADQIFYAGVHNAYASFDEGFYIAPNQKYRLELALEAGYRAINMDMANFSGTIKLIHGKCQLGSRDPFEVLTNIHQFLTNHPTEVILLVVEINEENDRTVALDAIYRLMQSVPGFTNRMYNDSEGFWPTLGRLVELDQRILFFHYHGQNCQEAPCPPGFHDWWQHAAETRYSFTTVEEIDDTNSSCQITRAGGTMEFFGLNVFVTLPRAGASATLNSKSYMENHIQACEKIWYGMNVTLVWVDFWNEGDLPQLTQERNNALGLALPTKKIHRWFWFF